MIEKLSAAATVNNPNASGLLMVGSFAPVHGGHFDAARSAERALAGMGEQIKACVFCPNSDSYVLGKLNDKVGEWNFSRRVREFSTKDSRTMSPSYVDDITGSNPPEKSISEEAIKNISRKLGILASNLIFIVGTDQMASMEPYLKTNRAVCVLRPGYDTVLETCSHEDWFLEANTAGRYVLVDRENTQEDISSTFIRQTIGSSLEIRV